MEIDKSLEGSSKLGSWCRVLYEEPPGLQDSEESMQQDLLRTALDSCWRGRTLPEAMARQGCGKTAGAPTDMSSSENAKKTVCRWAWLNPSTDCTALGHWNCFKMWQSLPLEEALWKRKLTLQCGFVKAEFYLSSSWKMVFRSHGRSGFWMGKKKSSGLNGNGLRANELKC